MDLECIICLSDISYAHIHTHAFFTKCCNKPIHNICMYNWIYNNNIDYNIHQCIYCRTINEIVIIEIPDNTITTPVLDRNNDREFSEYCKKKCVFLINCFIIILTVIIILMYL